jgi:hypothetical protein
MKQGQKGEEGEQLLEGGEEAEQPRIKKGGGTGRVGRTTRMREIR